MKFDVDEDLTFMDKICQLSVSVHEKVFIVAFIHKSILAETKLHVAEYQ